MSLIGVVTLCIITAHDTYELRRRLSHASKHHKRIIIGRVIVLWIASVTSVLAAVLTNIDNQTKEERLANLRAQLTPVISRQGQDAFIQMLKNVPKGEVPVLHEYASVSTYHLIGQLRQMLKDAGFKTNMSHAKDRIDLDVDPSDSDKAAVFILVKSEDERDYPVFAKPLFDALNSIGVPTIFYAAGDDVPGIDKEHVAILVLNAE